MTAARKRRKDSRPSHKDRCPSCKRGRIVMAWSGVRCSRRCGWVFCY